MNYVTSQNGKTILAQDQKLLRQKIKQLNINALQESFCFIVLTHPRDYFNRAKIFIFLVDLPKRPIKIQTRYKTMF